MKYTVLALPRSGTTSLANIFKGLNSKNEFMEEQSVRIYSAHYLATKTSATDSSSMQVCDFIRKRWECSAMRFDCASFNFMVKDEIVRCFPEMRFIRLIRNLPDWMESFLRMLAYYNALFRMNGEEMPSWMTSYGRVFASSFTWEAVDSLAKGIFDENGLALINQLSMSWLNVNRSIFRDQDQSRNINIVTSSLSRQINRLADFTHADPLSLCHESHVNKARVHGPYLPYRIHSKLNDINDLTLSELGING